MRRVNVRRREATDWTTNTQPPSSPPVLEERSSEATGILAASNTSERIPISREELSRDIPHDNYIIIDQPPMVDEYDPFEEHKARQAREERERRRQAAQADDRIPFELHTMEQFSPQELGVRSRVLRPKMFDNIEDEDVILVEEGEAQDFQDGGEEVFAGHSSHVRMTAHPDHHERMSLAREFHPIDGEDEETRAWEEQQLRKGIRQALKLNPTVLKQEGIVDKPLTLIPIEKQLVDLQAEQAQLDEVRRGVEEQLGRLEGRLIELEAAAVIEGERVQRAAFYRQLLSLFTQLDRQSRLVMHRLDDLDLRELEYGELTPARTIVSALSAWRQDPSYEQCHVRLYIPQVLEPHARLLLQETTDLQQIRVGLSLESAAWEAEWQELLVQVIIPHLMQRGGGEDAWLAQAELHLGSDHRLIRLLRDCE